MLTDIKIEATKTQAGKVCLQVSSKSSNRVMVLFYPSILHPERPSYQHIIEIFTKTI